MKNISVKLLKSGLALSFSLSLLAPSIIATVILMPISAAAQTQPTDNVNLNDSAFKIVVCDGPAALNTSSMHQIPNPNGLGGTITDPNWKANPNFVTCDFNGAMLQVQHLIDIAIVFGVVVAIGLFCFAGYLHITGVPANIEKSYGIFRKTAIGFIIMLSAWFIVYQVLAWLTGSSGFAVLLGKP